MTALNIPPCGRLFGVSCCALIAAVLLVAGALQREHRAFRHRGVAGGQRFDGQMPEVIAQYIFRIDGVHAGDALGGWRRFAFSLRVCDAVGQPRCDALDTGSGAVPLL